MASKVTQYPPVPNREESPNCMGPGRKSANFLVSGGLNSMGGHKKATSNSPITIILKSHHPKIKCSL